MSHGHVCIYKDRLIPRVNLTVKSGERGTEWVGGEDQVMEGVYVI